MTLHDLSQLYHLNREIEEWETEKDRMETVLGKLAGYSTTVTGSRTEFPYTPRTIYIGGVPVNVADTKKYMEKHRELQELNKMVELKKEECFLQYGRLLRYINEIPDSLTRQIFKLRFINGLPWAQVAASIGGGNTEEGVKKICYRFIERNG